MDPGKRALSEFWDFFAGPVGIGILIAVALAVAYLAVNACKRR